KADIDTCPDDVCFTPKADIRAGLGQLGSPAASPRWPSMSSVQLFLSLFSADSAEDRTVANVRLVVFLQPLGHVTTDRQIRQMVRRPRYAPQFNRSLPYPLAIWPRSLRRGRVGGHVAIKPVEKILFDDRK